MGRIKIKGEKQGLTNAKARNDAVDRIGQLEQMMAKVVESVNNSFQQIAKDNASIMDTIHNFDLVMQAMMEVLDGSAVLDGTEKKFSNSVSDALKRLKIAELEGKAEKQLAELKIMETENKIVKTDTITSDNDFVITTTKDEKGQQRYPTKSVGIVGMFVPAVKELLINKKAGETLTLPTGGTLEVLEVYTIVPPSEPVDTVPESVE
jgi:hypothetical protein